MGTVYHLREKKQWKPRERATVRSCCCSSYVSQWESRDGRKSRWIDLPSYGHLYVGRLRNSVSPVLRWQSDTFKWHFQVVICSSMGVFKTLPGRLCSCNFCHYMKGLFVFLQWAKAKMGKICDARALIKAVVSTCILHTHTLSRNGIIYWRMSLMNLMKW